MNRLTAALVAAPLAALGLGGLAVPQATAATATTRYVSTTGSDSGACTQAAPCKTVDYAIGRANAGDTISLAAGTYKQAIGITKAVTVTGAGTTKTLIDGAGIDYTAGPNGPTGLIDVANELGAAAGTITVSNLEVNYPTITTAESNLDQAPIDIDNSDSNTAQHVVVSDVLFGGAYNEQAFGGDGFYSLSAGTPSTVTGSTFQNLDEAAFDEGAGAAMTVTHDTFTHLAAVKYQGTTYPPVGVLQLSDAEGTNTVLATFDTFTGYAGYGVASDAGYAQSNCSPSTGNTCTGTADLRVGTDKFALTGATGAAGISLDVQSSADSMTANVLNNTGTVAAPSKSIQVTNPGGHLILNEQNNTIAK